MNPIFQGIYVSRIDVKHVCDTGIRFLAPYKISRTRPCFDVMRAHAAVPSSSL
jgi:hypothetical protein